MTGSRLVIESYNFQIDGSYFQVIDTHQSRFSRLRLKFLRLTFEIGDPIYRLVFPCWSADELQL